MPDQRALFAKILIAITEDWFALSHFRPLISTLRRLAAKVVVVTNSSGRLAEIEALGARAVAFDFRRSSMHPVTEAVAALALTRILRAERPDVVHLIAMKPVVLGSVASALAGVPHTVLHVTGLGFLATSSSFGARTARGLALAAMHQAMARRGSWLIVENPEDLELVKEAGVRPRGRVTLLGGAGIDPEAFRGVGPPAASPPIAAFVGRMIRPKGVEILMAAADRLVADSIPLAFELYGQSDIGNLEAIQPSRLAAWSDGKRKRWLGHTTDIAGVWRRAAIFVLPALGREGMPRAMLEAAASARPLVVSDVPGCRHFVRDGIEGLIVPPGDADALARALERLALDAELRARLGQAARARVLDGYTTNAVENELERTYRCLARIR